MKLAVDATINQFGMTFEYDHRTAELNNIPVVLEFASTSLGKEYGAEVSFNVDDMKLSDDDQWFINMPEIVNNGTQQAPNLGIGEENVTYNKSNIPTDPTIKMAFKEIASYLISVHTSNYYQNIIGQEQ